MFADKLEIGELEKNTFLLDFNNAEHRDRVLARQPWAVKGLSAPLQWPMGLSWQEVSLNSFPVWVQIHGLLLDCSKEKTAKDIGEAVGEVVEIEGKADKKVWCVPFIHIKVLLIYDLSVPLRFTLNRLPLDLIRIYFRYERLTGFCYICGMLGTCQRFITARRLRNSRNLH